MKFKLDEIVQHRKTAELGKIINLGKDMVYVVWKTGSEGWCSRRLIRRAK